MRIERAYFLHGQGGRKYQEDSAFPASAEEGGALDNRVWLVCDGMGGVSGGRVASETTCRLAAQWLQASGEKLQADTAQGLCRDFVQQLKVALQAAADAQELPYAMGTTLVGLYLQADRAWALHCGDSRLYHLRDGWVRWHTRDHSYVNSLVEEGYITAAEAEKHPKRHVLARALTAKQEGSDKIDAQPLADVQAGDWILLCSDGVYGAFPDKTWFAALQRYSHSPADFLSCVAAEAEAQKGDNYTAWLLVMG